MKNKFFTVLALLLPVILMAQPPVPLPDGDDDPVPINSAIVWLLVLGVTFGVYMVYKQQRKAVR